MVKTESTVVPRVKITAFSVSPPNSSAKVADKLLNIKNVDASFVLVNIDNRIHISARSNGTINVQLILEKIGGGGHFDVAGAAMSGSIADTEEILDKIAESISAYIVPEE